MTIKVFLLLIKEPKKPPRPWHVLDVTDLRLKPTGFFCAPDGHVHCSCSWLSLMPLALWGAVLCWGQHFVADPVVLPGLVWQEFGDQSICSSFGEGHEHAGVCVVILDDRQHWVVNTLVSSLPPVTGLIVSWADVHFYGKTSEVIYPVNWLSLILVWSEALILPIIKLKKSLCFLYAFKLASLTGWSRLTPE